MTAEAAKKIIQAIIREQEAIIGPLALVQANTISGLTVSSDLSDIKLEGNGEDTVSNLVSKYESLFGQVSVDACKESVKRIVSQIGKQNVPAFLQ